MNIILNQHILNANQSDQPNREEDFLRIISVGKSHWKKGYTYALDACKIIKNHGLKFEYTIIGGLNDLELRYQIRDLGLERVVILKEYMPFDTIDLLLNSSDILLMTDVQDSRDTLLLESLTKKMFVISTTFGAMNAAASVEENGFFVPVRNSLAIAETIMDFKNMSIK